jgi:hypothetical protein
MKLEIGLVGSEAVYASIGPDVRPIAAVIKKPQAFSLCGSPGWQIYCFSNVPQPGKVKSRTG